MGRVVITCYGDHQASDKQHAGGFHVVEADLARGESRADGDHLGEWQYK